MSVQKMGRAALKLAKRSRWHPAANPGAAHASLPRLTGISTNMSLSDLSNALCLIKDQHDPTIYNVRPFLNVLEI
jgi:hypothetical protein